jgi:hypothetical protein
MIQIEPAGILTFTQRPSKIMVFHPTGRQFLTSFLSLTCGMAYPRPQRFHRRRDTAAFKYYHSKNGFRYLVGLDGITHWHDTELCLFPTLLKSEFHGVRSTIERHSKMGRVRMPDAGPIVGGGSDQQVQDEEAFV